MADDPDTSFESVHQTNEKSLAFKRRLYKNPDVQKIIRNTLPTFDQLGLLDTMWDARSRLFSELFALRTQLQRMPLKAQFVYL